MDRTQLCGSCDAGSIPAEGTNTKFKFNYRIKDFYIKIKFFRLSNTLFRTIDFLTHL